MFVFLFLKTKNFFEISFLVRSSSSTVSPLWLSIFNNGLLDVSSIAIPQFKLFADFKWPTSVIAKKKNTIVLVIQDFI